MSKKNFRNIAITAIASISLSSAAFASDGKPQAEILHWWSSPGESAALNVLVEAFEARGGHYYDSTKDSQNSNRSEAIERMSKGYPSTLTQWNAGRDTREFYEYGITDAITDPELIAKLQRSLPKPILDAVTHNDAIIAMPVNIHSENWMWYSNKFIQDSETLISNNWQSFLDKGASLAKEDIPLLAVGDQSWQVRILFSSVFLGISRDLYKDFYLNKTPEPSLVDSEDFKQLLHVFGQLAQLSKSFGDGNWNTQVRAVANNEAGATFMGDWAKGEFHSLGKTAGKEYGCALTAGNDPSLLLVIDAFILGKMTEPLDKSGQALMLDVISDPAVNQRFNELKGSVSPFYTPPHEEMDDCSRQVYKTLAKEDSVIAPYASYPHGQYMHDIDHEIYRFWKASRETDSDATAELEISLANFKKIVTELHAEAVENLANIED